MRLARGISLLLFLALGLYAIVLSIEDRSQRYVRLVADRIELGRSVPDDQLARAARLALEKPLGHRCRSNILRPALAAVLFHLDRFDQATDYDAWAAAHADASALLAAEIACLPTDGNIWLRAALVSRAIAEDPQGLRDRLALASKLMPYEEQQVLARLFLWKRLTPYTLSVCADLARADIRAVLLYGSPALKKFLGEAMSPDFEQLVKKEITQTSLYHISL